MNREPSDLDLLSKRNTLKRQVGRGSATNLLSSSYSGGSGYFEQLDNGDADLAADPTNNTNNNNNTNDEPEIENDDEAQFSSNVSASTSVRNSPAKAQHVRTTYKLPSSRAAAFMSPNNNNGGAANGGDALLSPGRRARSNSVPALTNFSATGAGGDDDDDYLEEDTIEAIWERFAPFGSRGTVRRVRPVVVRDEQQQKLLDQQLSVHKRHLFLRVFCLVLMCVICFGDYINFDVPGALIQDLKAALGLKEDDDAKMGVLYSVYTFPNIVVVLLGGYMIDRIGLRFTTLFFTALVVAGSVLMALAQQFGLYWLAVVARFVYGLGGESVYVCVDAILCEYFDQAQLSIAMTIQAAFLNLGDLVTFSGVPRIAELYDVAVALWFVAAVCACAFVAAVVWVVIDKLYEPEVESEAEAEPASERSEAALESAELPAVYLRERKPSDAAHRQHASVVMRTKPLPSLKVIAPQTLPQRLAKRMRVFDVRFWTLALTAASLSAATTTFSGFAPDLLLTRFPTLSQTDATTIVSSISIANIVATPVLGVLFSRMRQVSIGLCVTFGMALMSVAHFYLGCMPHSWPAWPPMAIIGAVYALLSAALWPTLPLVVRESRIGTAYGFLYALTNAIVSALYALVGWLIHTNPGTVACLWGGISAVGCLTSIAWNISMTRKSGGLWATLTSPEALALEPPA